MNCNRSYYIELAEAFAALSYQGVYLLDTDTNLFVFTSDSPILRSGHTAEEVESMDLSCLAVNIPDEEKNQLVDMSRTLSCVYAQMPIEKRRRLNIYLNFHEQFDGRTMMVCHKLRMLDFDADGMPHLALGIISYAIHRDEAAFFIGIPGEEYDLVYNHKINDWEPAKHVQLSDDERDMLRLTMQGYKLEEIGKIMCKSTETIKFYRRQVFSKMNVESISQAVAYATHHRLI